MVGKYKVVTLCGSTRFKDAFMETQKRLTLEGNIVISVGVTPAMMKSGRKAPRRCWTICTSGRSIWQTKSLSSMSVGILVPVQHRRLSMRKRLESQ